MNRILLFAVALSTTSALNAANPVYTSDDLFLGFRKIGATQCYLVNIGQASQFTGATAPFVVNTGGTISADLSAVLGDGWATDPSVKWSVSGTTGNFTIVGSDPAKTLYATKERTSPATQATAWSIASSTIRTGTSTRMTTMANTFTNYEATASSPFAVIQGNDDANSYATFQPGGTSTNTGGSPGISFAAFNSTVEGSFTNGTAGTVLDLFRIPNTSAPGSFTGSFTITASGEVTFTPPTTAVIPLSLESFTYLPGQSPVVTYRGNPGTNYIIQRSTTLQAGGWVNLSTLPASAGGTFSYTDNAAPAGRAFYRAIKP